MAVECSRQRVAESCFGRELTVLQRHFILLHEVVEGIIVFLDVGEIEVNHLQHGLYILRSSVTVDTHLALAHGQISICNLTCESLLKLSTCEISKAADADNIIECVEVCKVLQAIGGRTTASIAIQEHLIFLEVGLLQNDFHTVGEFQCGVIKLLALGLFLYLACLGHLFDERFVLNIVNICRDLFCACSLHSIKQLLFCRINITFFLVVEVDNDHVTVVGRNQFLYLLIDSFKWNHRHKLLHRLVSIFYSRHRFISEEVAKTLTIELRIIAFVLVAVLLFEST